MSSSAMVKLLKQGADASAPPVWVMPVFGGTTACFDRMLNSYSGYKRTVYGITDGYIVGNDEALTLSFEEWVATYVSAIKTKQEHGPYTLVGYSQGMHWCYAVAEALRSKGEAIDAMVVLDPNFPAWNQMDRVLDWDAPQVANAMGIPVCLARIIMSSMMVGPLMSGAKKMKTQAEREATFYAVIAKESAKTDLYDTFLSHTEMDTGKQITAEKPTAYVTKIPSAERMDTVSSLIASKFEGLDDTLVKRILQFRAVSVMRWPGYAPKPVPASTKIIIAFADRSHIKSYKGQHSITQGFERFAEKGMAQIEELIIKMDDAPHDWAGKRMGGAMAAFDQHFRFMHTPNVWTELKARVWDKLGMF